MKYSLDVPSSLHRKGAKGIFTSKEHLTTYEVLSCPGLWVCPYDSYSRHNTPKKGVSISQHMKYSPDCLSQHMKGARSLLTSCSGHNIYFF